MEIVRGRVGVRPWAVVVAVRIRHIEEQRPLHQVPDDRARRVGGRTARADRDDVEHRRAAGDRRVRAEGAVGRRSRRGRRRDEALVRVRRCDVDGVPRSGRPRDGHGRAGDGAFVRWARQRQGRRTLRVPDVAVVGHLRQRNVATGAEVAGETDERRRRPRQRRRRAGRAAGLEPDRRDGRIGAERRRRQVGQLPVLLGDEAHARGELLHAEEERRRVCAVAGSEILLAALGRQHGPKVPRAHVRRGPGMPIVLPVAVPVTVVAVPAGAARRVGLDGRVHDGKRCSYVRVVRRELTEAD